MDENGMLNKDIIVNNKTYNVKLYIKIQDIIFELESLNNNIIKNYEKSFSLVEMHNLDDFFKQSNNLLGVFKIFKQLFNTQISIEEGDSFLILNLLFFFKIKKLIFI